MIKYLKERYKLGLIAMVIDSNYLSIKKLLREIEESQFKISSDSASKIYAAAYIYKRGICDKLENLERGLFTEIYLPSFHNNLVTVYYLLKTVRDHIINVAKRVNESEMAQQIIGGRAGYYLVESNLPEQLKKNCDERNKEPY